MKNLNEKILHVKPVTKTSPQGRHNQVYTMINQNGELVTAGSKGMNKEENVISEVVFPRNPATGKLKTGLEVQIPNPFLGSTPTEIMSEFGLDAAQWSSILVNLVEQERIRKQTYYEILDGTSPDYYTSNTVMDILNPTATVQKLRNNQKKNFLESFSVILYPKLNTFKNDTPRGRLAIALLEAQGAMSSSRIAATKADIVPYKHDWYLIQEGEEQSEKRARRENIKKAMHYLYEVENKLTDFDAYKLAIILKNSRGDSLIKGMVSPNTVTEALEDFVNASGTTQDANVEKFIELYEDYNTPEGKEVCYVRYLIQQALNSNVLYVRDGYYVWPSQAGVDNVYKMSNYEKLIAFFLSEYRKYNPKDTETTNYFYELRKELTIEGVKVE